LDNCPFTINSDQPDRDRSGIGDICEEALANIIQSNKEQSNLLDTVKDSDGDGISDTQDACPTIP